MPLSPTVHRCRSEIPANFNGRSDLTVEYLDTSSEVERYLDPSTIRSLTEPRQLATADHGELARRLGCTPSVCWRHAPWANWRAHICTCEHITRMHTHARQVCTHTPADPHALFAHGRTHHAPTCRPFESGCAALRSTWSHLQTFTVIISHELLLRLRLLPRVAH